MQIGAVLHANLSIHDVLLEDLVGEAADSLETFVSLLRTKLFTLSLIRDCLIVQLFLVVHASVDDLPGVVCCNAKCASVVVFWLLLYWLNDIKLQESHAAWLSRGGRWSLGRSVRVVFLLEIHKDLKTVKHVIL